ncbi:MAG: response regulator [Candidatus Accumulibacter sp.]|jgi:PAS domain S-box-containing protein|nr:response regulator [Accumulibacter sp.]
MDKHKQLLDAIFDASLDGVLALSESIEKPHATAIYSALFPGWENLRYNEPLEVVRNFYLQYLSDVDVLLELVAEVRRTRERREGRIHLLDGRVLQVIGKVIKAEDGSEIEVWTYRDITERCRQDEQLQLRLQIITAVLDASGDAIFAIVEGLEKPLANARYSSLFPGWDKDLRYGQPLEEVEDFFARYLVDWKVHVDLVAKVRQTKQYHQAIIHHKDGRIIDMSGKMVHAEFIQRGALEIYTLRDITGEVRGRQKLLAMQMTVDNLSAPVVWFDITGKITYVNRAACAALGYDGPAEMVGGDHLAFLRNVAYDDGVFDTWGTILAALRENLHIRFDHTSIARKDGTRLPCTILIDYIDQGSEPFLAVCFHDLSEQIQRIEAERATEAKSGFLARMSHEIRTPMNAIIGLSELAQREYGKPKALEYITGIKSAGASLLAIINDILDFSKIESGNLPINPAPYDTASLLNDALTIIRVRIAETPLELIVDASPDIPRAMIGDAGRIKQILLNLLSNAVKYTNEGFIKFSISCKPVGENAIGLTFVVEDSGIGIRQEDMPKLFGEFARIDEKRNSRIEGTGLGLAIARSLCQAMSGDITVSSEYGRGSVFTATMTQIVDDWKPMGDMADMPARRAEAQRVTFIALEADVLIVDDFPSNLLVAEGLLVPYKMRVFTCLNGREAVDLVRERPFDLVLMDHMMPEMDGVEATHVIRAMDEERCRTMPIVALTANAVSGMREMFLENGFNDFLSKPIEVSKLDAVLKKWIPADKRRTALKEEENALETVMPESSVPEIAGVDVAAGIARIGGSPSRYLDLLEVFCRDARAGFPLLEKEPDDASLRSFTTLVHALKSALANIGADGLSQVAALLEKAAREGDARVICNELPPFRQELVALVAQIGEIPALARSDDGEQEAGLETEEALARLLEALNAKDMDSMDAALTRLQAMRLAGKMREAVSEIADYILTADFGEAEDIIRVLLGRGN